MQESSVYQYIIEKGRTQGIEQGELTNTVESILELLSIRFQVDTIETLEVDIASIDNLQRLKYLRRAAATVQNLQAFMQILQNGGEVD